MLLSASRSKQTGSTSRFALLATLSFGCGYVGLFGIPPLPSESRVLPATDWLVWIILVAGVIQLLDEKIGLAAIVARWLLGGGMLYLVMRATIEYQWEGAEVPGWLAIIALVGYAIWSSLRGLTRRMESRPALSILFVVFTALAICSALTGSAKIAQVTGLLCSGLGAFLIVSWMRPLPRLRTGDVTLFTIAALGLGLCAIFYSELPILDGLLIAGGCVTPWLIELPYFRTGSDRQLGVMRILFVIAIVGIAVTRSVLAFESNSYGDYEY